MSARVAMHGTPNTEAVKAYVYIVHIMYNIQIMCNLLHPQECHSQQFMIRTMFKVVDQGMKEEVLMDDCSPAVLP